MLHISTLKTWVFAHFFVLHIRAIIPEKTSRKRGFFNDIRILRMIYALHMIYPSGMIYACGVFWSGYYIMLAKRVYHIAVGDISFNRSALCADFHSQPKSSSRSSWMGAKGDFCGATVSPSSITVSSAAEGSHSGSPSPLGSPLFMKLTK